MLKMIVIVACHADAARAAFFFFSVRGDGVELVGDGDMPEADMPRNIGHWERMGFAVRDIRGVGPHRDFRVTHCVG